MKVALITGAGKGLGKAIAFSLSGYKLVLHTRNTEIDYFGDLKSEYLVVKGDLTDSSFVQSMFSEIKSKFGRLDVVINTVGDYLFKNLFDVSETEWGNVISSNLNTARNVCNSAVPLMRINGFGRIVNFGFSRVEDLSGYVNTTPYQIAKTGVLLLSRAIAKNEALHGITCNVISPGSLMEAEHKADMSLIPAGRYGSYSDVVNAVEFLISEKSSYVTGNNIFVSGGYGL